MHDSGVNQIPTSSPYSKMADIQISTKGIESLLKKLSPHKSSGPDQHKHIVVQNLHKELAPIVQVIFQRSIDQAKLPSILKQANMSPIFKKGDTIDPANYRPISLTCALCKVLEHIVASNISNTPKTKIFFMTCSMGSERNGPARPS